MPPFLYGKQSILRGNVRNISALDALFTRNVKKIRKKLSKNLVEPNKSSTFATANEKYNISSKAFGVLTERLGNGLQNRVERFDSARHLSKGSSFEDFLFFVFSFFYLTAFSDIIYRIREELAPQSAKIRKNSQRNHPLRAML
jgi:hypothetical protein